uniref:Oxidoreductase molybdopterin-binding domain-containing protein n=1 Tax=Trichogramma kaykai TaxID=54128 RepID=A0ABD2W968_9HYME
MKTDAVMFTFNALLGIAKRIAVDNTLVSSTIYGTILPVIEAKKFDILLAYEMNGQSISPEHGYPVRVVIPQLPGRKNVKWLWKIILEK